MLTKDELKALFAHKSEPNEADFADVFDGLAQATVVLDTDISINLTETTPLGSDWIKNIDLSAYNIPDTTTEIFVDWGMVDNAEIYDFRDVQINPSSARRGDAIYVSEWNQSSGYEFSYGGWLPISPSNLEIEMRYTTGVNLSGYLTIKRYR